MKNKLAFLAIALIASVAVARGVVYRNAIEFQALTRATPLVTAPTSTAQLDLTDVKKIRLSICSCTDTTCAAAGGNLTGGNIQCWYNHPALGWMINPDLLFAVGAPAQTCRTFADMISPSGNTGGAMLCVSSAVTLASGTGLKVSLEGIANE